MLTDTMPRMGGAENHWSSFGMQTLRGLGASALIYELGKGMLGADLSRGLTGSAMTDIFGGQRFFEQGNEFLPLPPVVAVPKDLLTGLMQGDMDGVRDGVARLIPGGIAMMRGLGVMPSLPGPPGDLQKTYANWSTPLPDGRVPVYNSQGTLVNFRSPTELILRGVGADLSGFQTAGALDGFLMKNKEEIDKYKRAWIDKVFKGDTNGAKGIEAEYRKRMGVPLLVSQAQIKNAIKNREVARSERVLDRMPKELRGSFGTMVPPSLVNAPLASGDTSRTRQRVNAIPPEQMALIQQRIQEAMERVGPGPSTPGFSQFDPY